MTASRNQGPSVVVMGVSGSGKTTIAEGIAAALHLHCIDGDDLHSAASVAKMASGTPLDDTDRWPWLERIGRRLADHARDGGLVVACSALKLAYRDCIRRFAPATRFVLLDGEAALILERLRQRRAHYMPPELLASQMQTLELPRDDEPGIVTVDIDATVDEVVAAAVTALRASWAEGI